MAIRTLPNFVILALTLVLLGMLSSCSEESSGGADGVSNQDGLDSQNSAIQLSPKEILLKNELMEVERELAEDGLYFLYFYNALVIRVHVSSWGKPTAYYMTALENFVDASEEILSSIEEEYENGKNPFQENIVKVMVAQEELEKLQDSYPSTESLIVMED